ncbi:MAG: hypothetical protein IPG35_00045 [Flavobacteriales bacterium]|nr:hypothetical protein [Flavobacteriales bacterium]
MITLSSAFDLCLVEPGERPAQALVHELVHVLDLPLVHGLAHHVVLALAQELLELVHFQLVSREQPRLVLEAPGVVGDPERIHSVALPRVIPMLCLMSLG